MNETSRAAYVIAQAACAHAEVAMMEQQNTADRAAGRPITYQPHEFAAVPDRFLISHNAVILYLREG